MAKILRRSYQFCNRPTVLCGVARLHVPKGVWPEGRKSSVVEGAVDDLANWFSCFPMGAGEAICGKALVGTRFEGCGWK
ncbi:MAG: hypothetical protein OXD48_07725 [Litoreibacter sp.]|nr:hypothetical protein [Litoreibacter sp.]